jgi:hypothetical protein
MVRRARREDCDRARIRTIGLVDLSRVTPALGESVRIILIGTMAVAGHEGEHTCRH